MTQGSFSLLANFNIFDSEIINNTVHNDRYSILQRENTITNISKFCNHFTKSIDNPLIKRSKLDNILMNKRVQRSNCILLERSRSNKMHIDISTNIPHFLDD